MQPVPGAQKLLSALQKFNLLHFSETCSADVSGRIWPTVFAVAVNLLIQPNIQKAIARSRGSYICTTLSSFGPQMALNRHKA